MNYRNQLSLTIFSLSSLLGVIALFSDGLTVSKPTNSEIGNPVNVTQAIQSKDSKAHTENIKPIVIVDYKKETINNAKFKPYQHDFSVDNNFKISTEEFYCMVKTIWGEARGESYLGQIAVGNVIMNRVKDKRYPDTICGVVKLKRRGVYHFSTHDPKDTNYNKIESAFERGNKELGQDGLPSSKSVRRALQASYDVVSGAIVVMPKDSMNYHADYVSPKWSKKLKRYKKVDSHIFYTGY